MRTSLIGSITFCAATGGGAPGAPVAARVGAAALGLRGGSREMRSPGRRLVVESFCQALRR